MTAYLVTGGTGLIGRHLLGELVKGKEAVFVLVRPKSKAKLAGWGKRVTAEELEEMSPEGAAMAFLMKGIHF
ncbi:MAG TPA: SDR family oxidoreductase [Candidatus Dormibacteraeota bacterium]